MKSLYSIFGLVLALTLTACGADAQAEDVAAESFQEGKDYIRLARPVPVADDSKIEVVEAFWYGCIHCYNLEAEIVEWKKALPEDVDFKGLPAIWRDDPMELHAKMYYANLSLNVQDVLHQLYFDELNVGKKQLRTEASVLKLVEKHGVDPEKYRRALNSFGVNSQVQQAKSRIAALGVRGTPEIYIAGKYRLTARLAGDYDRMLEIASALIKKERKERAQ